MYYNKVLKLINVINEEKPRFTQKYLKNLCANNKNLPMSAKNSTFAYNFDIKTCR